jgi:hypothetical protein
VCLASVCALVYVVYLRARARACMCLRARVCGVCVRARYVHAHTLTTTLMRSQPRTRGHKNTRTHACTRHTRTCAGGPCSPPDCRPTRAHANVCPSAAFLASASMPVSVLPQQFLQALVRPCLPFLQAATRRARTHVDERASARARARARRHARAHARTQTRAKHPHTRTRPHARKKSVCPSATLALHPLNPPPFRLLFAVCRCLYRYSPLPLLLLPPLFLPVCIGFAWFPHPSLSPMFS